MTALAMPFLGASPQWEWIIRSPDDLLGAEVNASIAGAEGRGVILGREGIRHISLISKPLTGLARGRPIVEVSLSQFPGYDFLEPPVNQRVILFWQTAPNEAFRMLEQSIVIREDGTPAHTTFIPPVEANAIHRIGVQVPDASFIVIHEIRMVDVGLKQRIDHFHRDFLADEQFGGDSVNYYTGPSLLGRSLNYYLLALCGAALGFGLAVAAMTRHRVTRAGIMLATLLPWLVGDIVFSTHLVNRALAEGGALRTLNPSESLAAVYGDAIANGVEPLRRLPRGSRVAVLAGDGVTAGHRLAYLAAPSVVLVEQPQQAEFIVFLAGGAEIVDAHTLRTNDTRELIRVRWLETWSGNCRLFVRTRD